MTTLKLDKSNYKEYVGYNIVAFSYSEPGAMGEKGAVYMVNNIGNILYANFINDDISINEIQEVCPIFQEYRKYKFLFSPEDWHLIRLGFGNFLVLKKELKESFESLSKDLEPVELYKEWKRLILKIIK